MDFTPHDDLAAHRDAARRWGAEHLRPEWVADERLRGDHHHAELHRLLADQGLLAAGWPPEHGGSAVDERFADAVFDEIHDYGLASDGWITTWMVLKTLQRVGTEEQKRAVIPAALRGEVIIALGYTEPGCGSDLAAARTRAVRAGDGWLIDGAKMFTSTADRATHVFLLTRTSAPKHRGLTFFLVPLDAPGVEIQPVHTVGGQRTNATFYSGVRVPDGARVGDVDGGWDVVRIAMVFERGTRNGNHRPGLLDRVVADRPDLLSDPGAAGTLARLRIDEEVARLLTARAEWITRNGGLPGVEGSMAKLYTSEAAQRQHSALLDLLGPEGVLDQRAPDAPVAGEVEFAFRNSLVDTIYGGTSEIMREIVAAGRLGLPRSRPAT
ncbi:acyl-CoA dehydrogenase family protein [Cryptosporangium arvum]|uniref:acyl-CoA dehydrogenase family protein n=1 Tax=Cryptosporangium arvum TaxID=80871 RepID=UPI0004B55554|nr:acyl-CoA dehydrogenase family protein [Cryptosporangium arvum]